MPSKDVLDFAKLLEPISGDNPVGVDLRQDSSPNSLYYAVKDARKLARALEKKLAEGEDPENTSSPDWRPVLDKTQQILAEKSKDLELVAYLLEALVRIHGFAGLRDGFRLTRELIERYWDKLYPLPNEEGLSSRVAPLANLNGHDSDGVLLDPILQIPLTDATNTGKFHSIHYQDAVTVNKIADPKARQQKIERSKIAPLDKIQQAVKESSVEFYRKLADDLTQALEQFKQLTTVLDQRCKENSPPSSRIRSTLEGCFGVLRTLAGDKITTAPVVKDKQTPAEKASSSEQTTTPTSPEVGALLTRQDAFRALEKVAEYFRRTEPHTVVSYALDQVIRWGQMPLPELLTELIPEDAPRKSLFKQVGIRLPEPAAPPAKAEGKK